MFLEDTVAAGGLLWHIETKIHCTGIHDCMATFGSWDCHGLYCFGNPILDSHELNDEVCGEDERRTMDEGKR